MPMPTGNGEISNFTDRERFVTSKTDEVYQLGNPGLLTLKIQRATLSMWKGEMGGMMIEKGEHGERMLRNEQG